MSKSSVEKTMQILISTEKVADQILVNKQEILAYSKQKEDLRVALREIEKINDSKVWITIGSMPIKMKREKAIELLKKDQKKIDIEINKLRSDQKYLVNNLRDLELRSPFRGTNLKPLDPKEMSTLKTNLPLM